MCEALVSSLQGVLRSSLVHFTYRRDEGRKGGRREGYLLKEFLAAFFVKFICSTAGDVLYYSQHGISLVYFSFYLLINLYCYLSLCLSVSLCLSLSLSLSLSYPSPHTKHIHPNYISFFSPYNSPPLRFFFPHTYQLEVKNTKTCSDKTSSRKLPVKFPSFLKPNFSLVGRGKLECLGGVGGGGGQGETADPL